MILKLEHPLDLKLIQTLRKTDKFIMARFGLAYGI